MNKIEQLHLDTIDEFVEYNEWVAKTDIAASKCAEVTEQIAVEFMEWCRDNTVIDGAPKPYHRKLLIRMTTKELFQEFLKSKQ